MVQNAIFGEDNSVLGATVWAVTLVALSGRLNFVTARSRRVWELLEGQLILLIWKGTINGVQRRQHNVS